MGFMTEFSILNDNWHRLKTLILENPRTFTDEIDLLMTGRPMYGPRREDGRREYLGTKVSDEITVRMTAGYSRVYQSHHADEPALYLAYQNSFQKLDKWTLQREHGARITNPDDRLIGILLGQIELAQEILREAKDYLTIERQKHEVAKQVAEKWFHVFDATGEREIEVGMRVQYGSPDEGEEANYQATVLAISEPDADFDDDLRRGVEYPPKVKIKFDNGEETEVTSFRATPYYSHAPDFKPEYQVDDLEVIDGS